MGRQTHTDSLIIRSWLTNRYGYSAPFHSTAPSVDGAQCHHITGNHEALAVGVQIFAFPMLVLLSDLFPWLAHWHTLFLALFSAKTDPSPTPEWAWPLPSKALMISCMLFLFILVSMAFTMALPWHMWHSAALGSSGCWRLVQDPSKRRCMMWIIILCIWHFMVRMCIYVYTYIRTYTYYTYNDMYIYIYCLFVYTYTHIAYCTCECTWLMYIYIYVAYCPCECTSMCHVQIIQTMYMFYGAELYDIFACVYIYICVCCIHICGFSFFLTTRTTCMYTTSILYVSLYHTCAGIIWA